MLFIDSPIGSGWSYSNTNSDYQAGDVSTNDDLVVFILKWFQKYPIFKFRDLYLGGTSYAGYHLSDQIGTLPGQPHVNFRQFSGYIDVDPNAGRRPGCSSVGDSFVGIGPFTTTNNARGLKRNPYAWTKHFVLNLANTLLQCNTESKSLRFNVKGVVLGDPLLRYKLDILAEYELYASKGMVPKKLYKQILKHFNGIDEDNYYDNPTIWSEAFQQAMNKVEMIAFNVSLVVEAKQRQFDLFRTPCDGKFEDLYSGKEVTKIMDEVDMCIPLRTDFYFTLPEVQKAFHGNRTTLSYQYVLFQ
ncbi:hypothetical protein GOBAR_AA18517 [Gossypium barbadense]|uniref:Uncharacterized protein n=1 Tax=Gossypium barbadense TaxID=3634 RepID=A0A2P5XFM4_GOSBA|nr:hypothetical protein GOBAR_AA18517 [Gossypium barbadense]